MELNQDYQILFTAPDGMETIASDWEKHHKNGFTYFKTVLNGLWISVLIEDADTIRVKVCNASHENVTGFVGVRFAWDNPVDGYTLIPGIYYNGNHHNIIKNIPYLHLPESPLFQASLSAASVPAVFSWDGQRTAYHYEPSLSSFAGWNGVELDASRNCMTFYAPARENHRYGWLGFFETRDAFCFKPGEIVNMKLHRCAFEARSVCDLYTYLWERGRYLPDHPADNSPRVPEEKAEQLVRDWVYEKHCTYDKNGVPLILNAFNHVDRICPDELPSEWNIMIGWCSGTMTALPLLKAGGKYRDYAIKYIDFLTQNGNTTSGIKAPVYGKGEWMSPSNPEFQSSYKHCRFYADYICYLGKAIAFEAKHGFTHENWEKDFCHGISMLLDIWEKEHDFGLHWDIYGQEVVLDIKGSGAGAFALMALAEGVRHDPQNSRLLTVLEQAAEVYYQRCVVTGRCGGGPADILEADDSESIAALTDALVQLYEITGKEEHLKMALHAGHMFASWVLCYSPRFPSCSSTDGLNVCGGVLANVQNRHVGPGICTNSARFVHKLAEITGDMRWEKLYRQIGAAAINCVAMYDGEFWGWDFSEPFAAGMVTEQINVTDAIGKPGEPGYVSASWPATAVLLGYWDREE